MGGSCPLGWALNQQRDPGDNARGIWRNAEPANNLLRSGAQAPGAILATPRASAEVTYHAGALGNKRPSFAQHERLPKDTQSRALRRTPSTLNLGFDSVTATATTGAESPLLRTGCPRYDAKRVAGDLQGGPPHHQAPCLQRFERSRSLTLNCSNLLGGLRALAPKPIAFRAFFDGAVDLLWPRALSISLTLASPQLPRRLPKVSLQPKQTQSAHNAPYPTARSARARRFPGHTSR